MVNEAILRQLDYTPNDALKEQMGRIINNTTAFEKIEKHMMELHKQLKVDGSYIAMSNSEDYFKIKIEAPSSELAEEAHEKIAHWSEKYKVKTVRVDKKDTYYIKGFSH
jgi:phosphomannomutase